MASSQKVEFTINIGGNAVKGVAQLSNAVDTATKKARGLGVAFSKIGAIGQGLMGVFYSVEKIVGALDSFTEASNAQNLAEARLQQVMKNTMDASDGEYQSILALTAAQQKLGVVGDEVQLAGAQELGTYVTKTETLKGLIPVMNDMLAQQYGINASQEQAVQIGSMIGKVMNGQVGALSRYGYKFDEAQENIIKYGTEAEKMQAVVDIVSESVGGMNEALAQTPEGRIKQMENRLGDMKEQVGNVFTQLKVAAMPIAELGVGLMERLSPLLDRIVEPVQNGVQAIMSYINMAKPMVMGILDPVIKLIERIRASMLGMRDYLNTYIVLVKEHIYPVIQRVWEVLAEIVGDIIQFVSESTLLKDIFNGIANIFAKVANIVKGLVNILKWMWDNIVKPILNGVEKVYRFVTGKGGSSSSSGGATATKGISVPQLPGTAGSSVGAGTGGSGTPSSAKSGATAAATGGTRNTQITINLGKMIENMVFQGGAKENSDEIQRTVEECLLRTLNAATSIG